MRNNRKVRTGVVISDKMDKTVVVRVDNLKVHPKYKKVFKVSKKYHVHDEKEQANLGDSVRIMETKPLSKTKCWRLVEIVKKHAQDIKQKDHQQKSTEIVENLDNVDIAGGKQ